MSNNETEICVSEIQVADMCVSEAEALSCSPCIDGVFRETYPLALQAHFGEFLETSQGSAGPTLCVEQEESLCSFLQEFASCCCHEELISYTTCVYSAQLAESFPDENDCATATSCTLNASPSEKDVADSKAQNQWLMYGIYASIVLAIVSLLYCCCCSRRSRIRRRIRNKKGGTVEINVQCSSNTTETTNSKMTETKTNHKSSTRQQEQQQLRQLPPPPPPSRKRRKTPPRPPSSSSSDDDESFDWSKYNQTFHKRSVVVTSKSKSRKKKTRRKRVEESIRKARSVLNEAVKEQVQQGQVHKVFLMPALREVIDLLEEQRQDFEQKEKEVEEEKMRLQYDLEHTKSHLQSLERSHDRTQSELEQHYSSGTTADSRRNSTSTSSTIRRSSILPLVVSSSLPSPSSLPAINTTHPYHHHSYNTEDDNDNNNNNKNYTLPLDETESEEELQMEMMRLLTTLREKQEELLLLGGGGDAYDYPPELRQQEEGEDDHDEDYYRVQKGTFLGPAALQQQQSQSQRSFLGIDMTGSSWSGPLTDEDDDDLEYCGQRDPEYAGQLDGVPPLRRPSPPFASPSTSTSTTASSSSSRRRPPPMSSASGANIVHGFPPPHRREYSR